MVAPLPLDKRETDRMRVQVSWHAVVLLWGEVTCGCTALGCDVVLVSPLACPEWREAAWVPSGTAHRVVLPHLRHTSLCCACRIWGDTAQTVMRVPLLLCMCSTPAHPSTTLRTTCWRCTTGAPCDSICVLVELLCMDPSAGEPAGAVLPVRLGCLVCC